MSAKRNLSCTVKSRRQYLFSAHIKSLKLVIAQSQVQLLLATIMPLLYSPPPLLQFRCTVALIFVAARHTPVLISVIIGSTQPHDKVTRADFFQSFPYQSSSTNEPYTCEACYKPYQQVCYHYLGPRRSPHTSFCT
jgi:hypothetical protein